MSPATEPIGDLGIAILRTGDTLGWTFEIGEIRGETVCAFVTGIFMNDGMFETMDYEKMDREYIKDHQLIERHLQGKLSGEERQALEGQIMSSVDLLDEAEAAELLQQGLKDVFAVKKSRVPRWVTGFQIF